MKGFLATVKGKIILTAVIALVTGSVTTAVVFVNMGYRTIAVKALNGITQIFNGDKENVAYEGLHLKSGDNVNVNPDSDLTLALDEDKYIYAEPDTKFWIDAVGVLGNTKTTIHLEEGSQLFRIDKKLEGDEYFNVQTPNSTMAVRGTVFRVDCRYDETGELVTSVEVFEGEVLAEPVMLHGEKPGEGEGNKTGASQIISANHKATIHADETFSEFVVDEMGEVVTELQIEDYEKLPTGSGHFLGDAIDSGRGLCIPKDLLFDYVKINECIFDARHDEVPSTCTAEGHYYPKCSVCGKSSDEIVMLPLAEHTIIEEDVPGEKCGEAGTKYLKCSVCGITTEEIPLPEREHNFDEGEITKEPTKKATGIKKYTCLDCGETKEEELPVIEEAETPAENPTPTPTPKPAQTETTPVAKPTATPTPTPTPTNPCAGGHTYVTVDSKEATCNAEGYILYRCSVCNNENKSPRAMLSHKYEEQTSKSVSATCSEEGKKVEKCSLCGNEKTTVIDTVAHKYVEDESKYEAPTCTEYGYKYKVCSVCKKESKTRVNKTAHNYVEAPDKSVAPTCNEDGYNAKVCSICNNEMRTSVSKLGHSFVDAPEKNIEPTCTEDGLNVMVCTNCNTEKMSKVDALGHDLNTDEVKATCTEDGSETVICKRAGCTYKDKTVIPKLEHLMILRSAKTVIATCTDKGSKTYECSRCGLEDIKETEKDPDNHDYDYVPDSATYIASTDEYMHSLKCSRCNDIKEEYCVFEGLVCKCGYIKSGPSAGGKKGPSSSESMLKAILLEAMDYNIVANELTFAGHLEASFATKNLHGNASTQGPRYVDDGNCDYNIIGSYDGSDFVLESNSSHSKVVVYTTETAASNFGTRAVDNSGGVIRPRSENLILDFTTYTADKLNTKVDALLNQVNDVSRNLETNSGAYDFDEFAEGPDGSGRYTIDTTGIGDSRFDGSAGTYIFNVSTGDFNTISLDIKKNENQIIVFNIPDTNVTFKQYEYAVYSGGVSIGSGATSGSIYVSASSDNITKSVIFNAPNATSASFQSATNGVFLLPHASGWTLGSVAAGWLYTDSATVGGIEWHGMTANKPFVQTNDATLNLHVKSTLQNGGASDNPPTSFELYETASDFRSQTGSDARLIETKSIASYDSNVGTIDFSSLKYGGIKTEGTYYKYYVIKEILSSEQQDIWVPDKDIYAHIKVTYDVTKTNNGSGTVYNTSIRDVMLAYTLDATREMVSPVILDNSDPVIDFTNHKVDRLGYVIDGSVVLNGSTLKVGDFEFEINASTVGAPMPATATVTNDASGRFSFGDITFTDEDIGQTYVYTVKQNTPILQDPNIMYEDNEFTVTLSITLDASNNQLVITKKITRPTAGFGSGEVENIIFTNIYTDPDPGP